MLKYDYGLGKYLPIVDRSSENRTYFRINWMVLIGLKHDAGYLRCLGVLCLIIDNEDTDNILSSRYILIH